MIKGKGKKEGLNKIIFTVVAVVIIVIVFLFLHYVHENKFIK